MREIPSPLVPLHDWYSLCKKSEDSGQRRLPRNVIVRVKRFRVSRFRRKRLSEKTKLPVRHTGGAEGCPDRPRAGARRVRVVYQGPQSPKLLARETSTQEPGRA